MRMANMAIKREPHPMPTFEEMMPHVGKGKIFSKLDVEQAFHQMELHPNSRNITTFITKMGLYRYKRLNMGVVCAPEMFQSRMEMILMNCPGEILLRGLGLVIPHTLRLRTIELAHEGHPGLTATKQRLRLKVWWPKLDSMVEEFVRKCRNCLLVSAPSAPEPLRVTEMPNEPWRHIAIDFLGPLPLADYLLVTVDFFSRYIEIDIMRSIEAGEVIKRLKIIFARFRVSYTIKIDNGRQLIADEFRAFCDEYNIRKIYTIPYWPQQNGEVERQNRSILKRLQISHAAKQNWKKDLVDYLFMYRTTPHASTGKTPAELMFGRQINDKFPTVKCPLEGSNIGISEDARENDAERKEKGRDAMPSRAKSKWATRFWLKI